MSSKWEYFWIFWIENVFLCVLRCHRYSHFTHYRLVTVNKDTDSGVIHGDVRSQHSSYSSSDDQYPQPFWSDVHTSPAVNEAPSETEMMKLNPLNVIVGEEALVMRSWVGWMIISQFYANSFRWFVEQFAMWVDGEWAADSELEYNFWLLETSGNYSGSECGEYPLEI